jgi:carboxylesterase type B
VAPTGRNTTVNNGNETRICPQAWIGWGPAALEFGKAVYYGNLSSYNYTLEAQNEIPQLAASQQNSFNMSDSEDCLFLDVTVPKAVFDKRNSSIGGAPVYVW